jgi:hypothetical protein
MEMLAYPESTRMGHFTKNNSMLQSFYLIQEV